MGIQVSVKLADLPAEFVVSTTLEEKVDYGHPRFEEVFHSEGTCLTREVEVTIVTTPLGVALPVYGDVCMFDNKHANMHVVEELDAHGVQYTRG